jgi:2-polyprenyl-3-methyl-5-hydroxy-6-metoxy-1,4-benzoquinol methylase
MDNLRYRSLRFGSRVFGKICRTLNSLASRFAPDDIQETLVRGSTRYDMINAPDEPYYAEQYWRLISPFLVGMPEEAQCLDLGCSQGRFSLQLAIQFPQGKVLACDISETAIAAARRNAEEAGLPNIEYRVDSIAQTLQSCGTESQDIVMMTEVTFFYPDWQLQMAEIMRVLRPGALLLISFRSQYFDALCLVRGRLWHNTGMLLEKRRGHIFDTQLEFSWQTSEEIRALLSGDLRLKLLLLCGIGVCSGIPSDPHDCIVRPSQLDSVEKNHLMRLEIELGRNVPDAGRYILAVARKQKENDNGDQ